MGDVIKFRPRRKPPCTRGAKAHHHSLGVSTIVRESDLELRRKRLTGLERFLFEEQLKYRLGIPGENDALTWPEFNDMWKVMIKVDPDKHARMMTRRNKLRALIRARKERK